MKGYSRLFLFIASLVLFNSCGKTISHDKEVTYYVTITTEMENTTNTVNEFWNQMGAAIETANQNQDLKLDSSYVNQLNKSYQISLQALIASIDKLAGIEEIDIDINLKEKTKIHLNETKQLQEKALLDIIKALSCGLDKITDQQKESFGNFKLKGEELQTKSDELKKLSQDFIAKHNITSEELTKNGL